MAPVFQEFEEAVNGQDLGVVERLDSGIAALGLHLRSPEGSLLTDVHDVQIWSDGGISCRIGLDLTVADVRKQAAPAIPQ